MAKQNLPRWQLLREGWLLTLKADGYSPTSVRTYDHGLASLMAFVATNHAELVPEKLTRNHVREWLVWVRETRGATTASTYFSGVRSFTRWLLDEGEAPVDATAGVKTPQPSEPLTPGALRGGPEAAAGLLSFLERRDAAILRVLADGGLRLAEVAGVVLAFDGSFSGDSTALVACTVEDVPHIELIRLWERPDGPESEFWRVPMFEGQGRDQSRLSALQRPGDRRGPVPVDEIVAGVGGREPAGGRVPAVPGQDAAGHRSFYKAVLDGGLTHSGDVQLARHVANSVLREDSRGARITKEHKNSRRHIDAAVCAVMALSRELRGWLYEPVAHSR
jgi:Phage integrase, N-terminal SAM-like domain